MNSGKHKSQRNVNLNSKTDRLSNDNSSLLINSNKVATVVKAFEVDNAKQLTIEKTVRYFVPPSNFANLLTGKNHILLGSRGSGKTTWVRMLAHDHIVLAAKQKGKAYDYARDALERDVIGIYVPTNIGLVGSLKNKPWQDEHSAEAFFQWRLNLHSCAALIPIIRSCIVNYIHDPVDRKIAELEVCNELSKMWSGDTSKITTLESLRLLLAQIETKRVNLIALRRARQESMQDLNDYFDSELFSPIRYAMEVLTFHIGIPTEAQWMICIDEAEYLTVAHHRILNTHLRTAAGNLVFKIATMPFAHHTLATNTNEPVRNGHDFEYVYVDQVPIDSRGAQDNAEFLRFAREVFHRRLQEQSIDFKSLTLNQLLGSSPLIDEKTVDTKAEIDEFMSLLLRHANDSTKARAKRLLDTDLSRFRNEILRKMHGALLLRDALQNNTGNSKLRVYAGEAMVVRCADGNARRLVRLLSALSKKLILNKNPDSNISYPLDRGLQNEVLESIARDTLSRVQSEPPHGMQTYKYLMAIGTYMQNIFSARRLGSDFVSSIEIQASDNIDLQNFVKQSVQLSLLTPSGTNMHNGTNAPCEGVFHLAFLFAPMFGLLPRRNKAQRLPDILAKISSGEAETRIQTVLEI
jgi:hypothetical protein